MPYSEHTRTGYMSLYQQDQGCEAQSMHVNTGYIWKHGAKPAPRWRTWASRQRSGKKHEEMIKWQQRSIAPLCDLCRQCRAKRSEPRDEARSRTRSVHMPAVKTKSWLRALQWHSNKQSIWYFSGSKKTDAVSPHKEICPHDAHVTCGRQRNRGVFIGYSRS